MSDLDADFLTRLESRVNDLQSLSMTGQATGDEIILGLEEAAREIREHLQRIDEAR